MQNIKLKEKQISELIKNKKVVLNNNSSVEIYDGEVIHNKNGEIRYIKNMNLEFNEAERTDEFLQGLICEHFNIEASQTIMISSTPEDAEFKIRFTPDKEITIIICPITVAIRNTQILLGNKKIKINSNTLQIGLYRRLGTSCYFFRLECN